MSKGSLPNILHDIIDPQLTLTHPNKILYPTNHIKKIDLMSYYYQIGKWILPYIIDRPLSIVRCPQGANNKCFFQKHLHQHDNQEGLLQTIAIYKKGKSENYFYIHDLSGLLKLVQMNALEIHPWACRIDKLEKPDTLIFDMDPGPQVPWKKIIQNTILLRDELADMGLTSFVKTTGGKGLHIIIPIARRYHWDVFLNFSKVFVEYIVKKYPERFVASQAKSQRINKIFIDYLRNHQGATAIAPFSTRIREGAPIAMPLNWNELNVKIKSNSFNVNNFLNRIKKTKKDPWEGYFDLNQSLP